MIYGYSAYVFDLHQKLEKSNQKLPIVSFFLFFKWVIVQNLLKTAILELGCLNNKWNRMSTSIQKNEIDDDQNSVKILSSFGCHSLYLVLCTTTYWCRILVQLIVVGDNRILRCHYWNFCFFGFMRNESFKMICPASPGLYYGIHIQSRMSLKLYFLSKSKNL